MSRARCGELLRIAAIVVAVSVLPVIVSRAQDVEIGTMETSVQTMLVSKYIDINGDELYSGPAEQTEVVVSHGSGVYLYVFQSSSLDFELNNNYADEVDVGVGWAGNIRNAELDLGIFYIDEPKLGHFGAGDIMQAYGKVSFEPAENWTISATYDGFWPLRNSGFRGGNLFAAGIGRSFDVFDGKVTFSGTGEVVYDDGTYVNDSGLLARAAASVEWKITEHFAVMPVQLKAYLPLTMDDDREPQLVFASGFILRF